MQRPKSLALIQRIPLPPLRVADLPYVADFTIAIR